MQIADWQRKVSCLCATQWDVILLCWTSGYYYLWINCRHSWVGRCQRICPTNVTENILHNGHTHSHRLTYGDGIIPIIALSLAFSHFIASESQSAMCKYALRINIVPVRRCRSLFRNNDSMTFSWTLVYWWMLHRWFLVHLNRAVIFCRTSFIGGREQSMCFGSPAKINVHVWTNVCILFLNFTRNTFSLITYVLTALITDVNSPSAIYVRISFICQTLSYRNESGTKICSKTWTPFVLSMCVLSSFCEMGLSFFDELHMSPIEHLW